MGLNPQASTVEAQLTAGGSADAGASAGATGIDAVPAVFQAEVVALFVDLMTILGLPKSYGEIYGLLFASPEPLAFSQIETMLALSKGSVSQGLRALRDLGAVVEATELPPDLRVSGTPRPAAGVGNSSGNGGSASPNGPATVSTGGRATRWTATTELRQLIRALLRERLNPYLERQEGRLTRAVEALRDGKASGQGTARDWRTLESRLDKLQTWQTSARRLVPVVSKLI